MLIGSISPAYEFVDYRANKARTQQHSTNDNVEQVLDARHALIASHKGFLNGGVPFSTNSLMHSKFLFYFVHTVRFQIATVMYGW